MNDRTPSHVRRHNEIDRVLVDMRDRFEEVDQGLEDMDARVEEIESMLGLEDGRENGVVESEAVYVREDISVSDGFEDVQQWISEDEKKDIPEVTTFNRITSVNGIELFHNDDVGFLITNKKVLRRDAQGIRVSKEDLIELADIIRFETGEMFG